MDKDDEALLDSLIEIICGDKMIGAESALLLLKKDAERYRRLRENWIDCDELDLHGRLSVIDAKIDSLIEDMN